VELVLEDSSGRLTPAQRRGLEVAMLKVDEVVHIVEKIVSLSPMSSFALERTSIPVGSLLESMTRLMTRRVRGRPIEIHVSCPKPDLCIYGDYDKIKQVCYNILDNSIKFSPHGGDILVSASSQEGYVHLEFRDHGVGIPKKRLSRIFDTFYQVDGSSTRRFGGLGLGLTVVHRIVEAHDGKIWADSEVDRGTVFHILLPRYAEDSRVRQRLVSR
jgi:signal transduction histidine kinase